jgi:hypothetical protein
MQYRPSMGRGDDMREGDVKMANRNKLHCEAINISTV